MAYFIHIMNLVALYVVVSISLNLICGYTALISVCHAAWYGVGAYIAGLLSLKYGWGFPATLLFSLIGTAVLSTLVVIPCLRTREDYFIITTLAFQIILHDVLNNLTPLTRGPLGLAGIPKPKILSSILPSGISFLIVASALAVAVFLLARALVGSPFGRVLKAIREDEVVALANGKSIAWFKGTVFIIGAGMVGVAGALYAHYLTYIDPALFTVEESIFMLSLVIVGGAGRLGGSILGAALLVILPEALRFLPIPSTVAAQLRQILYGGLLVVFMMFRPQGLMGEFAFQRKV